MKRNTSKAFTVIELLVVVTIIIVLTTIGVTSFTQAGVSSRNSKRKADMENVRQALVLYRSDMSAYPIALLPSATGRYTVAIGTLVTADYLSAPVPTDPKNVAPYQYNYTSSVGPPPTFCLCAGLEGTNAGNSTTTDCSSYATGNFYCVESP